MKDKQNWKVKHFKKAIKWLENKLLWVNKILLQILAQDQWTDNLTKDASQLKKEL